MSNNKIKVGDLCLYNNIPVIVLERGYRYSSGLQSSQGSYSYLCLFYNSADSVSESSLRKL